MKLNSLRLEDFCEIINGGSWSEKEYVIQGIPVVKVTDMKNHTISSNMEFFISEKSLEKYKKHLLKSGDLIVATVGSHPTQQGSVVGRTSVVPSKFQGSLLNQNAACLRVKRTDLVSQKYLNYLSRTIYFKHHIESRARGSANQVRMAIGELNKFCFSYPPLPTQKKIAAVLSAYDDLIENNARRIALLERMAEELYKEWFVRMRFPGHESTRFEKGIPEGWGHTELGNLCEIKGGKRLPKGHVLKSEQTKYPYIKSRDIKNGKINAFNLEYLDFKTYEHIKNYIVKTHDVCITIVANIGDVGIVPKILNNANLTENAVRLRCNANKILPSFLVATLKENNFKEYMNILSAGAAQSKLGIYKVKRIKIKVPNIDLQAQFSNIFSTYTNLMENLELQNENLKTTRDRLLTRLISGKLSVEELDMAFPPSMQENKQHG